jgi:hypothetical protein
VDRRLELDARHVRSAADAVVPSQFRVDPQGLAAIDQCLLGLAELEPAARPRRQRARVVGLQRERRVEIAGRELIFTPVGQYRALQRVCD